MTTTRTYPSLEIFYGKDRRRAASREHDLGLWWRTEPAGPSYRAAWVENTGEIYLVQYEGVRGGGHVEVLGRRDSLDQVRDDLDGLETVCGDRNSVNWLRARFPGISQTTPRNGDDTPRRE
ncbi:MAG TPA: hypothetical protein VGF25_00555 [Thermoleophilaceae bacterium]|jgi:hypothetical protein